MKYIVLLSLLSLSSACSGMSFIKSLKKKIETTFVSDDVTNAITAQPKVEQAEPTSVSGRLLKLQDDLKKGSENLEKERLLRYQDTQRQNINGVIFPLLVAGICKFNANQSHPAGDAYFNFSMATWFSLGVSATFAIKFCTTPLPTKKVK